MKKFIVFLMVLGLVVLAIGYSSADSTRTISHKFKAITADAVVSTQGAVLYRVSGVASASPGVYGIYNCSTLITAAVTVCATEGGTATSGNPIELVDFGPEGLVLNAGMTVVLNGCTVCLEWL